MYAEVIDYSQMYPDDETTESELLSALEAAQRDIDGMTYNRICAIGFDCLTAFQQQLIRSAVCEQAKFRSVYADLLESPLQSYSINGVSMQFGGTGLMDFGGVKTTAHVASLLRQTGLCYAGFDRRYLS